jgi:hypothetical protein
MRALTVPAPGAGPAMFSLVMSDGSFSSTSAADL